MPSNENQPPVTSSPAMTFDDWLDRASYGGLLIMFVFAATLMAPLTFHTSRLQTAWCIAILLAPWLPQLLRRSFWQSLCRPQWRLPDYALMIFFIASGISCLTSATPTASGRFVAALLLTSLNAYCLCRFTLTRASRIRLLAWLWCLVGFAVAVFGFIEWYGQTHYALRWFGAEFPHPAVDVRANSIHFMVLFYLNLIPAAATFIMLLGGSGILLTGKHWHRWLFFGALVSGLFICIWLTKSRGGIIAVGVTTAIFLIRCNWRLGLLTILVAVIIGGATFSHWPTKIQTLVKQGPRDKNVRIRLENYRLAQHLARSTPWLGIGPRANAAGGKDAPFAQMLATYTPLFFQGEKRDYYLAVSQRNRTLDNTMLTIVVEHGLVAGVSLAVFIALILYAGFRPGESAGAKGLSLVIVSLAVALLAFVIQAASHDVHSWLHLNVLSGLIAGTIVCIQVLPMTAPEESSP